MWTAVLVVLASIAAYLYGVYSHAFRAFPVEEVGLVKRWLSPERGQPRPVEDVYQNTTGREQVSCWGIDHNAAVILAMGQSNAANFAGTPYRPSRHVYNFNWTDGNCYRAQDPLLGATGRGGSVWSRLGDALIESGRYDEVLLVPVAVGGTSVRDWAGEAGPAARAVRAAQALERYGLKITYVLWHQGESDHEMHKEVYQRLFARMTEYIRANAISAPVFVAMTSICDNYGSDQIRQAQRELPFRLANVFAGPDTDAIDSIFDRADNLCHFSDRGAAIYARLWLDTILRHETGGAREMTRRQQRLP